MSKKERGIGLLKKYGYLLVFGVCAVVLIVALAVSSGTGGKLNIDDDSVNEPVSSNVVSFGLPLANIDIIKSFSDKKLQFNETLKQYEAHLATDFACEAGASVYSVCDGTIAEVGNSYLKGNYVVVSHGNNLKTVYASLSDDVAVAVGQSVKRGDILGVVANSAYGEMQQGAHLHFEMLDNDKRIDPSGYLLLENK